MRYPYPFTLEKLTMHSRRTFLCKILPIAGLALATARVADAAPPLLDEKNPQAVALGYYEDAKKVDKNKFPKYVPGNDCANCQLYQGKSSDVLAPCPIFGGKRVYGKGWCNAYIKRI